MARTKDPNLFMKKNRGNCDIDKNSKMIKFTDPKIIDQYQTVKAR